MIKNENYIQISGWMVNELHLEGYELMIYALIYGFSQDNVSEFCGSIKYIQDWFGIKSGNTVRTCLKSLEEKNLILRKTVKGRATRYTATPSKFEVHPFKICGGTPSKFEPDNNKNIKLYKKGKTAKEIYNDFPQNKYNYDELEKELLSN